MNLSVLKLLLQSREVYTKHGKFVTDCLKQTELKELKLLSACIDMLFDQYDADSFTVEDLSLMLDKAYPNTPKTLLEPALERLRNEQTNPDLLHSYLEDLQVRQLAYQVATTALKVYETGEGADTLLDQVQQLGATPDGVQEEDEFVTDDVEALLAELEALPGLNWRLKALNNSLGPLRKGTFGFLFARPETGKTTFLASEISYMAEQLDRPLLWVNNEEESRKVKQRLIQASLGATDAQLKENRSRANEAFHKRTKGLIRVNKDSGVVSKKTVEQWCKKMNPGLIILDQIDKIGGFDAERYDLKMKSIYQWARELSKMYGPVIGVCQASGAGENKRWLAMTDIDSSLTAKAGEADFIIGIGKLHDEQYDMLRFLHLCKNKLTGKHSKIEVLIKPEKSRYEDMQ